MALTWPVCKMVGTARERNQSNLRDRLGTIHNSMTILTGKKGGHPVSTFVPFSINWNQVSASVFDVGSRRALRFIRELCAEFAIQPKPKRTLLYASASQKGERTPWTNRPCKHCADQQRMYRSMLPISITSSWPLIPHVGAEGGCRPVPALHKNAFAMSGRELRLCKDLRAK